MRTYHNDPELKATHVALSILHAEGDRLRAGNYGDLTTGIGCSVGCHAMDYGLSPDDHAGLAERLGWPLWLVRLQDRLFKGLPPEDRGAWHMSLAASVPVGVDLGQAYHRVMSRLLREVSWPADRPDDPWGCAAAVRRVAELHEQSKSAARSATRSAESAAWSAAKSAESAAWSAAKSAARSAARSATRSAAYRAICGIVLEELHNAETRHG